MTHCGNCRFWSRVSEFGTCARYPPVPIFVGTHIESRWPETRESDGCGEHEIRADVSVSQPDGHAEPKMYSTGSGRAEY